MKMAPTVLAVVISTLRATSPWAMYVATLLACPPGQQLTSMSPVASGGVRFSACAPPPPRMSHRPTPTPLPAGIFCVLRQAWHQ